MPELRELIKMYPGLGEVFADMENRLSYLENSQDTHREPVNQEPQEVVHRYVYEHEPKRDVRKQSTPIRQKGMTIG